MNLKRNYCLLFFLMIFMCYPVFSRPRAKYIAVKEIEAKSSPSVWGRPNVTFYYGDQVQVVEEKSSWVKVSKDGKSGWVKDSCITSNKIKPKGRVSVNADEIALAGKGFSNSLEAEYSNSYDIDFDVVDFMEKVQLSDGDLRDFIVDGQLKGAE